MNHQIVDALIRLRTLEVTSEDDFDRLALMGDFARLLNAHEELGEALRMYAKATGKEAPNA